MFERRTAPVIEPLMGYTAGGDTLTQVELDFPTLQAAIDYAERQGLAYVVHGNSAAATRGCPSSDAEKGLQAGADVVWNRLQLAWLQSSDGAVSQASHYVRHSLPEASGSSATVRTRRPDHGLFAGLDSGPLFWPD
ncbi:NADH dehydrogenase ubiquinone Fe-S protein 4 [Mesorhizobium ventifaucium]|uniref:NADH-ubiquinone oxidoreductase n=1 Tax=Mesorhizobium ventifaucium TaxID=666020 RepID=A0ABN8JT95_9HYPH|nr:hypothetical protein MES4922_280048 [Mesorhizobium ventifaucium]